MSDTPETDGITFFATKDMMPPYNTVPAEFARKLEGERDQARRELDIQLESIKFHMERKDEFFCDKKDSSKTLAECIEEEARIVKAAYFDSSEELRKARAERDEAREALKDANESVVTFCALWAAQYAAEHGLPNGHLHPTHYDILQKAGARMNDFTRVDLQEDTK